LFEAVVLDFPTHQASYRSRIELARLALSERMFDQARRLARQVATARSDDLGAEGQYVVGRSYAGESNWKEAATAFLRVRYVFPASREWNDRAALGLAEAYWRSGDAARAKETLTQFLSGSPDEELRHEGEALLGEIGG
jgi:tetratricopeptide (TPR) repeat protein